LTEDREAALRTLVEHHYGALVLAIEPIAEYGDGGGVYRVDQVNAPSWVVRIFAKDRSMARVRGDAAILNHVTQQGVPCERLVPTLDGSGCTELEGQGVIVTRFEGVRLSRELTVLRRLGEVLGQLHAIPAVPADDPYLGRRAGSLPREDLDLGIAHLDRVADRVSAVDRNSFESLKMELEATSDCEALPFGLIHSDCHLDNAIQLPGERIALIDWVGAGQGPRVASVGLLLYSAVVQSPGDDSATFERSSAPDRLFAIDAFAEGYCRHHTLTSRELDHLSDAIRVRPLVVAAREFARSIEMDSPLDTRGWWTGYGEAELIAAAAGEAFERHDRNRNHQ
jgi:Ser/Thr protein kinase RdoA (MazF antagonist)